MSSLSLDQLPHIVLRQILLNLDFGDLYRVSLCNHRLYCAVNDDAVWFHLCAARKWTKFGLAGTFVLGRESCLTPTSNISGTSPVFPCALYSRDSDSRLPEICKWKNVFLRTLFLDLNWRLGRYLVSPFLRGHNRGKIKCLASDGRVIVSGGSDALVNIWCCSSLSLLQSLLIDDEVSSMSFVQDILFVASDSGSIREYRNISGSWELTHAVNFSPNKQCDGISFLQYLDSSLYADGPVLHSRPVDFPFSVLVAYSSSRKLHVWRWDTKQLLCKLRGPNSEVSCHSSFHQLVAFGYWNCIIVVFDILLCRAVQHLHGHSEAVSCMKMNSSCLVSGSLDGRLLIWSLESGSCLHSSSDGDSDSEIYCLDFHADFIATGHSNSVLKVWDSHAYRLHTLRGHFGVVRNVSMNEFRLVSSGDVRRILVWDYRSGALLSTLHRNPSLVEFMFVHDTAIVLSSPGTAGSVTYISYW